MSKVLVVIDMQNDFVTGGLGTKEAQNIVPNVVAKLKKAKENGDNIFFTRDTHYENYMDTLEGEKLPIPHCIINSEGWKVIPQLQEYAKKAFIIDKKTFGFLTWLSCIPRDTKEIELIGVCTDICIVSNALILRANYPNMKITVDSSCCAGTSREAHESALVVMKCCQIDVK